ncbi:MAG: molybdenum ABC transporter ATP-binding protein [Burkholderiales bacterium]|nr:molybdenum ABC transporter ATP-binding protein [Burkholderiales bacterium]
MIDVDIEERRGAFHLAVAFTADAPIVGLFGRSGAGKTTLVNAIAGIGRPLRGAVRVNGHVLFDSARGIDLRPERRRIGYVFQEARLFPHLSVHANLVYGQRRRAAAERFIDEHRVVELLGLGALLRRKPRTLSGGERQRVAIGRALLAQPRILLMDEPLASLDIGRRVEILDYIERLRDELSIPIVYVSHAVAEIARLADTVVLLSEGKCLAVGDVEDVMARADLRPATGRYESGSLIEARVLGHDATSGLTTLGFDGGELVLPRLAAAPGERVRARVRARDVSLALRRPEQISILNVLPGRVAAVRVDAGPVAEVTAAVGTTTIHARVTRKAVEELGLREGRDVFVLVKAVSLDQRSVGYA